MYGRLLAMAVATIVLCGCGERRERTAFVVVNGHPISVEDVRNCVLVFAKSAELAGRPIDALAFPEWANQKATELFGSMIEVELLSQEVARTGINPTAVDREKTLAEYNRQLGRNAVSVDALAAEFGDLTDIFKRQFELAVEVTAYRRIHWSAEVSDKMVDNYFVHMTNALKRAKAVDAEARAKAEKAYGRLKAGESWEKVAADCSEDRLLNPDNEKFSEEWLTVTKEAYGIKPLAEVLPSLKKGEFTRPLDTRDGLVIFRLIDFGFEGTYRLARILFRMSSPVSIPETREEARKSIAEQIEYTARRATLDRIWKAAKFNYPLGTNFEYRIWNTEGDK